MRRLRAPNPSRSCRLRHIPERPDRRLLHRALGLRQTHADVHPDRVRELVVHALERCKRDSHLGLPALFVRLGGGLPVRRHERVAVRRILEVAVGGNRELEISVHAVRTREEEFDDGVAAPDVAVMAHMLLRSAVGAVGPPRDIEILPVASQGEAAPCLRLRPAIIGNEVVPPGDFPAPVGKVAIDPERLLAKRQLDRLDSSRHVRRRKRRA